MKKMLTLATLLLAVPLLAAPANDKCGCNNKPRPATREMKPAGRPTRNTACSETSPAVSHKDPVRAASDRATKEALDKCGCNNKPRPGRVERGCGSCCNQKPCCGNPRPCCR